MVSPGRREAVDPLAQLRLSLRPVAVISRADYAICMGIDRIWHCRGSVELGVGQSPVEAMSSVAAELTRKGGRVTRCGDLRIDFLQPLASSFFRPNWKGMSVFDRGTVWIEPDQSSTVVRYDFSCLHGFIFCLFAAAMFFALATTFGGIGAGAVAAGGSFAWLYGMSYVAGSSWASLFVRDASKTNSPNSEMVHGDKIGCLAIIVVGWLLTTAILSGTEGLGSFWRSLIPSALSGDGTSLLYLLITLVTGGLVILAVMPEEPR